ncbi:tyrosine--tRNA ligase [Mucisphaera calidilacus]|uniref:Tyrosine--tRNA ligase n=1 Tax=Mucisphaera calidilacus TaxID=2527982 RepID=A0A518BW34_9BACT|nr:tyrosine--tRNA ligase [Mucisphaera calidilacus]QDU71171.1 Tyrosine--tRNA ligase [Mucisphaera calidilacus]
MTQAVAMNLYDVLSERGLVAQSTDAEIRKRLEQPVTAYIGFDPTADSLHVGSLVPIMVLAWLSRCGHKPLVLVGGATGLVGDPSGKTESRKMLTREQINANAEAIAAQIGRVVPFGDGPDEATLVNNADWLEPLTWIELLRDVGSRVSVNRMLSMESVKGRIDSESGISYLEFSYMIMQAYDFAHLNRTHGCTVQMGGQDQWGNIVMGVELGRKLHDAELAGLTMPLITKPDGGKFGKSEKGNVWLDAERTSPYEFYQFWRNTPDAGVGPYLRYFTFLPMERVRELETAEGRELNAAKEVLAYEVTKLIHGEAAAEQAQADSRKAFGASQDVTGDSIPHETIETGDLGLVRDLLVRSGMAKSNGEAKKLIQGGGVRVGESKVADINHTVGVDDAPNGYLLLRVGKKRLYRFDLSGSA